jgi:hypothetical protein
MQVSKNERREMLVRRREQFTEQAVAFLSTLAKSGALRKALKPRRRVGKKLPKVA